MYIMILNFSFMDTKFSIDLKLVLLFMILVVILSSNLLCACARVTPFEGFTAVKDAVIGDSNKNDKLKKNTPLIKPIESTNAIVSTSTMGSKKEGFVGANINYGESSKYNIDKKPIDTTSWMGSNLTDPSSKGFMDIVNRPEQPVPLPEGEMLMFANTEFKPECCNTGGSAYSNSTGCACITVNQYNGLIGRWGNNVPYSEY